MDNKEIPLLGEAGALRIVRLQADTIRAVLLELLGLAMPVEGLREVLGLADKEHFVLPLAALVARTIGDDIHSADLAESRAQGKDPELICLAEPAFEQSVTKRWHAPSL
jgi:hypothetical protein